MSRISDINNAKPGDTIILEKGLYDGLEITCKGTKEKPIAIVGRDAVFSSGLIAKCEYTHFIGFEVRGSEGNRQSNQSGSAPRDISPVDGISVYGEGNKFINLIVHDNIGNNIGCWKTALENEIYGCIIYNAGWDSEDRGHGYNIYTQNELESGIKNIENCFIFNSHRIGISAYGGVDISSYNISKNTVFNNGMLSKHKTRINLLAGSKRSVSNMNVTGNTFYQDGGSSMVQFGYTGKNKDASIEDNYFVNDNLFLRDWEEVDVIGNTFIHNNPIKYHLMEMPDPRKIRMKYNTYFSDGDTIKMEGMAWLNGKQLLDRKSYHLRRADAKNSVEITPNKYDPSRIHITVRNPERLVAVAVDMSQHLEPGTDYEIIDVQNYFGGSVSAGVYKGGSISLPMNLTEVSEPTGNVSVKPKHTGIELGTFILKTKQL